MLPEKKLWGLTHRPSPGPCVVAPRPSPPATWLVTSPLVPVVSAKLRFAGFQHSSSMWDDIFFLKRFLLEKKTNPIFQKKRELPPSTGVGVLKAEGLQPRHGCTWFGVMEERGRGDSWGRWICFPWLLGNSCPGRRGAGRSPP